MKSQTTEPVDESVSDKSLLYSHLQKLFISQVIVLFDYLLYSKRYEVFIKTNLGKWNAGPQEKLT